MSKEIKEIKKTAPEGVKILSVVSFILTGLFFAIGMIFLKVSESVANLTSEGQASLVQQGIPVSSAVYIIMGIVLLALSVIFYYLGKDLAKLKNWARITGGIIAIIVFIMNLLSVINGYWSSIASLIIAGIIAWYLLFNKKIIKHFN